MNGSKKGLGRGLNNLIPGVKEPEEKIVEVTADTVLKINDIEPNRNQPRKTLMKIRYWNWQIQ